MAYIATGIKSNPSLRESNRTSFLSDLPQKIMRDGGQCVEVELRWMQLNEV